MERKTVWPAPRTKWSLKRRVFKVILKTRVFKIFNHFLLGFPLSNSRKAKIQTFGFQTLVENVPDDPEKATWKALTLPTNALPGNPFYSFILEENFWSQNSTFLLSDENIPSPECNVSFLVTTPSYIQAMRHQPWVTNMHQKIGKFTRKKSMCLEG